MKIVQTSYSKPEGSIIDRKLEGEIDYIDSFSVEAGNIDNYSADYLTAVFFSSLPNWVKTLLGLRNILVKPFGIHSGSIPDIDNVDKTRVYNVGERVVFFTLRDRTASELVMAEDDKHLYFRTSLFVSPIKNNARKVHVTTLVQYHNALGKIYFMPVKPFHKLIIKTLLKNCTANLK